MTSLVDVGVSAVVGSVIPRPKAEESHLAKQRTMRSFASLRMTL
jgi:hypothetical protein